MAEITNVEGFRIVFEPKAVYMVTDRDASTGEAITGVYGIIGDVVRTKEAPEAFLTRIEVAAGFAKLTRPNKSPIWLAAGAVKSLREPLPNEYVAGVKTVIAVANRHLGVTETVEATLAKLKEAGANL